MNASALVLVIALFSPYVASAQQPARCQDLFMAAPSSRPDLKTAEDFYRYISRTNDLKEFAQHTYGTQFGLELLATLKGVQPAFQELISDVPLMSRIDDFVRFASERSLGNKDPWHVRDLYRSHLGRRRVYRSLRLYPEELPWILRNGLQSYVARGRAAHALLPSLLEIGLLEIMRDRLAPNRILEYDVFLSVTDYAEIAASIPVSSGERRYTPIFIFEIEMPAADLFANGPRPFHYPPRLEARVAKGLASEIVQSDSTRHRYMFDAPIERFAVYNISPADIVAVYEVKPKLAPRFLSVDAAEISTDSDQSFLKKFAVRVR